MSLTRILEDNVLCRTLGIEFPIFAFTHCRDVVAAVSTGGISHKRRGRVGDSPVPGAGFWADDRLGPNGAVGQRGRVQAGRRTLHVGQHRERQVEEGTRALARRLTRGPATEVALDGGRVPASGATL